MTVGSGSLSRGIAGAPVIVVPDMSPLIHLAAAGQLGLLNAFGHVVVVDIVAHEATSDLERPWARQVAAWLAEGRQEETSRPVEVARTEIGEAYRLARITDPRFTLRDAGENAIRDWLADRQGTPGGSVLVIYEDKRLPRLLDRERFSYPVVLATTRSVLGLAEARGLIPSAEAVWTDIIRQAVGANPSRELRTMPRSTSTQ